MPAFHELPEMLCSQLKVIGCLYILGAHRLVLVFVKVCHSRVFIRVGRVTGVTLRHMAGNLMGRG